MAPPNEPHPPPPHNHHVAALAFPFATHAGPLLAILHRLATAAPNTLFSFFNTSQSNNSLFSNTNNDIPSNIKVYDVADGVPEGYVFVGKHQEDIELFLNAAPHNFRSSLDASVADTGRQLTGLITDAFLWFGANLAHDLGVPWVPVWLSGINSLSAHLHTDLIRHNIPTPSIAGRENELISNGWNLNIPGLSRVRIKDLPEGVIFGNLDSVFSRMLHQMGQLLPRATALVINSFDELDPENDLIKSKFNKLLNVGPSNLLAASSPPPPPPTSSTADCLSWLDKQTDAAPSSTVYVSFGSVAKPPEEELIAIAEALEASRVPFIWSLKESFKTPLLKEFLTSRLTKLKTGLVVPWAPQPQVLAHASVGAFITHCGWSSLLETIAGGVPMICRPFFGDQRLNARMVADVLEIGVTVEGGVFTKNGVMQSMNQVLSQERDGNKFRDNVKAVKQLAQQAVGRQGSSTQNFKLLLDVISATNNNV